MIGEFPVLREFVVVSPVRGRLLRSDFAEGSDLDHGAIIGVIRNGGPDVPVVCPVRGRLGSWLAGAGEPVTPGVPIAWIVPDHS